MLIILQKLNEKYRVLDMNENVEVINQIVQSNLRSINLIETLMGHVLPHLYPT